MPWQPAGADYPKMLGTVSSWSHGVVKYARAKADSLTDLAVNDSNVFIQVVPGRAGGGSFKRKKNYIAKKEFAYKMCAR